MTNYVVVTKTKVIGYCVDKRDAENLQKKGRNRAIFDTTSGEMMLKGGIKNSIILKEYCKCFRANKTATIVSYHVFGTKDTKACVVTYRGKLLQQVIANDYEAALVKKMVTWASDNGFTDYIINYN